MAADPRQFLSPEARAAYGQAKRDEALLLAAAAEYSIADAKVLADRRRAEEAKHKKEEERAKSVSLKQKEAEDRKKKEEDASLKTAVALSILERTAADVEKDIIALSLREEEERKQRELAAQIAALKQFSAIRPNSQNSVDANANSAAHANVSVNPSALTPVASTGSSIGSVTSSHNPKPSATPLPISSPLSDMERAKNDKNNEEAAMLASGNYVPLAANRLQLDDQEGDALDALDLIQRKSSNRSDTYDDKKSSLDTPPVSIISGPYCDRKHSLDIPQETSATATAAAATIATATATATASPSSIAANVNANPNRTTVFSVANVVNPASASATQLAKVGGGAIPRPAGKPLIPQFSEEERKAQRARLVAQREAELKAQIEARANKGKTQMIINGVITWK